VLVSGSGSNLQALIDAQGRGELAPARLSVVVSNNPTAGALARASGAKLPAVVLDHRQFASRDAFEADVVRTLGVHGVELVVLAGFTRLIGPTLLSAFANRILNVHPSLLPAFPGLSAVQQALDYGVRLTGCTVHLVDHGTDTGPIVLQAAVPVDADDDSVTLHDRIRCHEHRLLPEAVRKMAQGGLVVDGRRARFR
jgi:phosphoribosylglycinamide formyltransferase-1